MFQSNKPESFKINLHDFEAVEEVLHQFDSNYKQIASLSQVNKHFGVKETIIKKQKLGQTIETNVMTLWKYIAQYKLKETDILSIFSSPGYVSGANYTTTLTVQNYLGGYYIEQKDTPMYDIGHRLLEKVVQYKSHLLTPQEKLAIALAQQSLSIKFYWKGKSGQHFEKVYQLLQNPAAEGFQSAQAYLGQMYYCGYYVPQDYQKAYEWFIKAVDRTGREQGYIDGNKFLGEMYYYGRGVPQNFSTAYQYFSQLTEPVDTIVKVYLGTLYTLGEGVVPNFVKARDYLLAAQLEEHTSLVPDFYLAKIYLAGGHGLKKDVNQATKYLERLAQEGGADVQCVLASCYQLQGKIDQAIEYYQKAANQGHYPAILSLFYYYFDQFTIDYPSVEEVDSAISWLAYLTDSGDPLAKNLLTENILEDNEEALFKKVDTCIAQAEIDNKEVEIQEQDNPIKSTFHLPMQDLLNNVPKRQRKKEERNKKLAYLRERYQKIANDMIVVNQGKNASKTLSLEPKNKVIVQRILNKDDKLNVIDFYHLFKDPLFQGQLSISRTKSGFKITSNRIANQSTIISTHIPHNGGGLDFQFLDDLGNLLYEFVN